MGKTPAQILDIAFFGGMLLGGFIGFTIAMLIFT